MIALKDDPVWTGISAFGNPFPPFDFGSGMGVRNISRKEALELGVLTENDIERGVRHREAMIKDGTHPSLNGHLEASINMRHDSQEAQALIDAFGDQIQILNDKAVWQGNIIQDVLSGNRDKARLGEISDYLKSRLDAVDPEAAARIKNPSINRNILRDHIEGKHIGKNEKDPRSVPLAPADFELIPSLWRRPDYVTPSGGRFILEMETFDQSVLTMIIRRDGGIATIYKRKTREEACAVE